VPALESPSPPKLSREPLNEDQGVMCKQPFFNVLLQLSIFLINLFVGTYRRLLGP
jgi:hypothetical protein